METLDIIIVVLYFSVSIGIALYSVKKAGKNPEEFFLSGRKLPWWIAGTTMVATTFAADTPLAVTELVATKGIAGNWLWWNMVAGNILTVFFFAKLWRRANILTDVEFIELRYSGKPAAFLRGFKALYLGLFMNVIIMGWVNLALATILEVIFDIDKSQVIIYILLAMLLVGFYSAISGMWGIAYTDIFQFVIAIGGCIILAVVILNLPEIGGMSGLIEKLPKEKLNFIPQFEFTGTFVGGSVMILSFSAFIAHIGVQWWASWYPGAEPGGGGYIAQRMMSAKDEKHSLLATLWFSIAHYAIRPWPWIIVALASLILYPDLAMDDKKTGFVLAMKDHLPVGLLGLLVAAFLAAYMSTISTHLNWGSSYLINDLYKRFIKKNGTDKEYVLASRIVTLILVVLSGSMIFFINSISGTWTFIIESGAGLGLVLILRWYWWRINAWSEISAMIIPFFGFAITKFYLHIVFPESLFFIVTLTTVGWLIVTFITKPESIDLLQKFYDRVYPGGPGWNFIKRSGSGVKNNYNEESLFQLFINWILGVLLVYVSLFGIGKIIFQEYITGIILSSIAIMLFIILGLRIKEKS